VNPSRPIGLYDSGIGGLSVVREVFKQLPHETVLYLGDTARVPYGPRPAAEILAFNREIVAYQLQQGVKLILIACNTSSAIALGELQSSCPVPIVGLIAPGAEAALAVGRRVGVIATEGTVLSGAYGRALVERDPSVEVLELACPTLVPLVESGDWTGASALRILEAALMPMRAFNPDCLILGCTHYPHLAPLIQSILGPAVTLVDPAARAVALAASLMGENSRALPGRRNHRFIATGEPEAFLRLAKRLLPGSIEEVEALKLEGSGSHGLKHRAESVPVVG
jgi:glutamate racemase